MTDQPTCDRCGGPIHDQAYVCAGGRDSCTTRLRRDLETVARIAGDATDTIARQARTHTGGRTSSEPPLNFGFEAADAQWAGANTLTTWARHIAEIRGQPLPSLMPAMRGPVCTWVDDGCRHPTCHTTRRRRAEHPQAVLATWLANQLDWLRHRPEAAEAYDELGYATWMLIRTVDRSPDRWYAGPCGVDGCDQDLAPPAGATTITCPTCRAEHDADARRDWLLDQADDQLAHAAWIASALTRLGCPVQAATVRKWAERGQLSGHGHDQQNRPLYRLGEVHELALDAARREYERQVRAARKARGDTPDGPSPAAA